MVGPTNKNHDVSLRTRLANGQISLTTCVYNASGPRTGSSAALNKIVRAIFVLRFVLAPYTNVVRKFSLSFTQNDSSCYAAGQIGVGWYFG
jgi:hypothetical protein